MVPMHAHLGMYVGLLQVLRIARNDHHRTCSRTGHRHVCIAEQRYLCNTAGKQSMYDKAFLEESFTREQDQTPVDLPFSIHICPSQTHAFLRPRQL